MQSMPSPEAGMPERSSHHKRASEELFGSADYIPKNPHYAFITEDGRWVTYNDLVEEFRNA